MVRRPMRSLILVAVIAAIGCGGNTPQDASATTDQAAVDTSPVASEASRPGPAPMQLAQVPPGAATQASASGSASVQGIIRFAGDPPSRKKIRMGADPVCLQSHTEPVYSDAVVVNDNGMLSQVFVYVKEGLTGSFPTPSDPVILNQTGCRYAPHIAGIQVNQPLQIVNSDSTLHNVNAKPTSNRPFNVAQPVKGMKMTKKFTKPEIMVRFKCNVHPWMSAYLGVLEHPFFGVSGADGAFAIPGLPDGTYVIEAWHETFGTQTQRVQVAEGKAPSIEFTFSAQ